jgi:hypothetical protein
VIGLAVTKNGRKNREVPGNAGILREIAARRDLAQIPQNRRILRVVWHKPK